MSPNQHAAPREELDDQVPEVEAQEEPVVVEDEAMLDTEETETAEEVLPEPSDVHPAASVEVRRETLDTSVYGKYFIGMWGDKPNFGCPYCSYASIEGEGDVELHVLTQIDSGDLKHMAALQLEGE